MSGFTVTHNVFNRTARAFLLGGGRDNVFDANTIQHTSGPYEAVQFDNRGMTWGSASCTPPGGILIRLLGRVPYNTSAVWIGAFPALAVILANEPCVPRNNNITNNTICGTVPGTPWIDVDAGAAASWGSLISGNVNVTSC